VTYIIVCVVQYTHLKYHLHSYREIVCAPLKTHASFACRLLKMNGTPDESIIFAALSSLAPHQLAFVSQAIDVAFGDYSNAQTAQTTHGRGPDWPLTSYASDRCAFRGCETTFR
jgi:hypothetical protein